MEQVGRNLVDVEDGFLRGRRYLIRARDPLFTRHFEQALAAAGTKRLNYRRAHRT
jgi:hypothetical protein